MTVQHNAAPAPSLDRRRTVALVLGGVIAAGALGFGGAAFTNAWFTSQATIGEQQLATGTVSLSATIPATSAPISATGLVPGDTVSTTIRVSNDGTEDLYYTIGSFVADGDAALASALRVAVAADGIPTVTRSLSEWATGSYEGIALASGATAELEVTVTLPTSATNELQGTAASFTVPFTAVQQDHYTGISTPTWTAGP